MHILLADKQAGVRSALRFLLEQELGISAGDQRHVGRRWTPALTLSSAKVIHPSACWRSCMLFVMEVKRERSEA
jgi:hypothetical protein